MNLRLPSIAIGIFATFGAVGPAMASPADEAGRAAANPFAGPSIAPAVTSGTVLVAPATEAANTSSDGLAVVNTGTGRAISGTINNTSNGLSAVKGLSNGPGGAILGVSTGTAGQAGSFQITNAGNAKAALSATTAGAGNAVIGIVSSTNSFDTPAVLGQHNATAGYGVGVEGNGGNIGVRGYGVQTGVVGMGSGNVGTGVFGTVSGASATGVYGQASGAGGYGVVGYSLNGAGLYAYSDKSDAIFARVGASSTGYAADFEGPVRTNSTMTAQSYATTSDRNAKQSFEAVDNAGVLDKVAALPISAWDYKDKPGIRHIGPMAQDFRAAFGLGVDDTHIDMVDAAGVSLAAIQALQQQLKRKEAEFDALKLQVQALARALDERTGAATTGGLPVAAAPGTLEAAAR